MASVSVEAKFSYPVGLEEAAAPILGAYGTTEAARVKLYGDQDQFQKLKGECVEKVVRAMKALREAQSSGNGVLIRMLKYIGKKRQGIAKVMRTKDYEQFGRLMVGAQIPPKAITALIHDRQRELNQRIREIFYKVIKEDKIGQKLVDTNFSRYTVERFTPVEIKKRIEEELKEYQRLRVQTPTIDLLDTFNDISESVKRIKLNGVNIPNEPDLKPYTIGTLEFLVGTVEAKMNGEWRVLTRHVVWINNENGEKGPITPKMLEHFEKFSFATLLHTRRREVEFDLNTLNKWANLLIRNKYENPKDFDRHLAFLEHRLFHVMPFERGSASIIEIFREAICRVQDREVPKRIDDDAFAEPDVEKYIGLENRSARKSTMPVSPQPLCES